MRILTRERLEAEIRDLLRKYELDHALLFGSYARGEADERSDIDVVLFAGPHFRARDVFSFGEELRQRTGKNVDVFEIREVNEGTDFYNNAMKDGVRIA